MEGISYKGRLVRIKDECLGQHRFDFVKSPGDQIGHVHLESPIDNRPLYSDGFKRLGVYVAGKTRLLKSSEVEILS